MSKFFTRQDVQQLNKKLITQTGSNVTSLSATSQKIVRETKFSREEINSAFQEARRRLEWSK